MSPDSKLVLILGADHQRHSTSRIGFPGLIQRFKKESLQDLANSVGHRLPPLFPTQLLNWAGKLSLVVQLRRCGPAAIEVTHESADNSTSTMQRDWQQFVQNNGRLRQASALSGSNRVLASAEANEYLQREESAL